MVSPKQNVNISRISIENFKAFGKRVDVPIRPITLIFGENSSGKSSILHSLLFLNQLQHQPPDKLADVTYTKAGGNSVDLGGLPQLKYGHKDKTKLFISVEKTYAALVTSFQYFFNNKNDLVRIDNYINNLCLCSLIISSKHSKHYGVSTKLRINVDHFIDLMNNQSFRNKIGNTLSMNGVYRLFGRKFTEFSLKDSYIDSVNETLLPYKGKQLTIEIHDFPNAIVLGKLNNIVRTLQSANLENSDIDFLMDLNRIVIKSRVNKITTYYDLGNTLNRMLLAICNSFQDDFRIMIGDLHNITYIGPIRTIPTRNFDTLDSITRDPSTGSTAWETLASDTNIRDAVNTWLLKFGTNKEITTEQSVDTAQIRKLLATEVTKEQLLTKIDMLSNRHMLRFYDAQKDIYLSHRDLGIGISQVLPVIVESVANSNTTVLIEQPELHLHPRLQGDLADLFIETAIKGEQQNTYIIETHSEHIIRRIMRRIREDQHKSASDTRITKDDVAILYVANGSNGSTITHLRLDDEGDLIDEWPNGFFEEGFRDDMAGR